MLVGELARQHLRLRSGRKNRRPTRSAAFPAPKISNPTFIDQRPAQAEDRRMPGHWEGDLIIGKNGASATASLVERTSRFLILVPLAGRDSPTTVTSAVATGIAGLPDTLRRPLTWDCGTEMAEHAATHQLTAIADRLNSRPRRILGYRMPKEVFAELRTSQIASTGWGVWI
ncbi:IS30 family transposase [Salinispora oceanensis]|uniref:IS30 family transposase n=1 Tax=Salinispora oceanensis TaxID=1050199 RepID=UPI00036B4372|nr:IS30 family transposase [Salinispora oceanensis]